MVAVLWLDPLNDFYIDMPDVGLRKGRNMLQTCKAQLK
jgi:hypothetical protein